jgi:hypothetical protein
VKRGDLFTCHSSQKLYLSVPDIGDARIDDWGAMAGKYGIIIDPEPVKYCDKQIILVLIDGSIGHMGEALIKVIT